MTQPGQRVRYQVVALDRRRPICAGQVECFQTAVPGLDRESLGHLLLTAVTLVTARWSLGKVSEAVLDVQETL